MGSDRAAALIQNPKDKSLIFGKARLVRAVYEGRDISATWTALFNRVSSDPNDAAAFMDLSIILQTIGQPDKAALSQKAALDISRSYRIENGRSVGPNILVFVTAGDFMANTPIEFLLETSDANILLQYVDAATASLADVPDHDVAFVAVGESADNLPVLENLERLLRGWTGPIMNNASRQIIGLSRDGVAETFKDERTILAPATERVARVALAEAASNGTAVSTLITDAAYPVIIRPVGTHAGKGMEKISTSSELAAFLDTHDEPEFYVAPFIDYSGPDGRFRKQRIAFIDGKAYASHLAVSDHWMVHYLSAGMARHEERRAEEAAWMTAFDDDFAVRHAPAFEALHRRLGLDYFAIDCAELADGRLLLFEADVAMIVHAMDSAETFPYKKRPMQKLFTAFEDALRLRARGHAPFVNGGSPSLQSACATGLLARTI